MSAASRGAPLAERMHIAIIGAGISGLACAHALQREGGAIEVTLLEAASRGGGVVRSDRPAGYLTEYGPNGFLAAAPETLALVEELGLRHRLVASDDRARRRFVYRRGRLRPLPSGPLAFLGGDVLSLPGRLRLLLEPLIPGRSRPDESIHSFAARRFGREAADVLADAMATGIFGGGARDLSVRACLPQLWQLERDHGGLVRGLVRRKRAAGRAAPAGRPSSGSGSPFGRLMSFQAGIEELPAALTRSLGGQLRLSAPVSRIEPIQGTSAWRVGGADGTLVDADHVVLAVGAPSAARLVGDVDPELAGLLDGIKSAPIAVVCLGYDESAADARFDAFGFLVPDGEGRRVLGAVWETSIFPDRAPAGHTLVRILIGGGRDPGALALDDESLIALAGAELRATRGITSSPCFARVIRQVPGLPQYVVGHPERVERIDRCVERHPGLHLLGNSYRGLALNACIAEARRMARSILHPPFPPPAAAPV